MGNFKSRINSPPIEDKISEIPEIKEEKIPMSILKKNDIDLSLNDLPKNKRISFSSDVIFNESKYKTLSIREKIKKYHHEKSHYHQYFNQQFYQVKKNLENEYHQKIINLSKKFEMDKNKIILEFQDKLNIQRQYFSDEKKRCMEFYQGKINELELMIGLKY